MSVPRAHDSETPIKQRIGCQRRTVSEYFYTKSGRFIRGCEPVLQRISGARHRWAPTALRDLFAMQDGKKRLTAAILHPSIPEVCSRVLHRFDLAPRGAVRVEGTRGFRIAFRALILFVAVPVTLHLAAKVNGGLAAVLAVAERVRIGHIKIFGLVERSSYLTYFRDEASARHGSEMLVCRAAPVSEGSWTGQRPVWL